MPCLMDVASQVLLLNVQAVLFPSNLWSLDLQAQILLANSKGSGGGTAGSLADSREIIVTGS